MVWTQESYHRSVNYDRPGECSPEKDCLRWHWLTFRQPKRKSSSKSNSPTQDYTRPDDHNLLTYGTLFPRFVKHHLKSITSKRCFSSAIECYWILSSSCLQFRCLIRGAIGELGAVNINPKWRLRKTEVYRIGVNGKNGAFRKRWRLN